MLRWWLRYGRLWLTATEARLTLQLNQWAARTLSLVLGATSLLIGGLLCTTAGLLWLSQQIGWVAALLLTGSFWLAIGLLLAWQGPKWLLRFFSPQEALYRLRLAKAGMQLIEKHLAERASPTPVPDWLQTLLSWAWRNLRRLLLRRLRAWLPL